MRHLWRRCKDRHIDLKNLKRLHSLRHKGSRMDYSCSITPRQDVHAHLVQCPNLHLGEVQLGRADCPENRGFQWISCDLVGQLSRFEWPEIEILHLKPDPQYLGRSSQPDGFLAWSDFRQRDTGISFFARLSWEYPSFVQSINTYFLHVLFLAFFRITLQLCQYTPTDKPQ